MSSATSTSLPIDFVFGRVRHLRTTPKEHGFAYRAFYLRVAVHELTGSFSASSKGSLFAINRPGWLSFQTRDHGNGDGDLYSWISQLLAEHDIVADGEIWLHSFARVLGYQFKPVSFWFCHTKSGALAAVVAEVNNTFGERHLYLLANSQKATQKTLRWGQTLSAQKSFHVSPFFQVNGHYKFRFFNSDKQGIARIDYFDQQGLALTTSLSGEFCPITARTTMRAILLYPLFSIAVMARIHWHAARLWLQKRIAYVPKPQPPKNPLTKGQP
jgi:uncharacterized protein